MKTLTSQIKSLSASLLLAATAAGVVAPARATLYPSEDGWWFCATPAPNVYITSVFDLKDLGQSAELRNAFAQELAAKYGYSGAVDCSMSDKAASGLEQINLNKKSRAAQLRQSGVKVVETEWAYEPAAARFSYVCSALAMRSTEGAQPLVSVFTDRIAIGAGAARRLREAWGRHLKALHLKGGGRSVQCELLPANAEAPFKASRNVTQIDWSGWDDPLGGDVAEPPAETSARQKYLCEAWAFPPSLPPAYYWTGVFESGLSRSAAVLKWRDRLKSAGQLSGPVPTIHCVIVQVLPEQLEHARETGARESGASVVRMKWKE